MHGIGTYSTIWPISYWKIPLTSSSIRIKLKLNGLRVSSQGSVTFMITYDGIQWSIMD